LALYRDTLNDFRAGCLRRFVWQRAVRRKYSATLSKRCSNVPWHGNPGRPVRPADRRVRHPALCPSFSPSTMPAATFPQLRFIYVTPATSAAPTYFEIARLASLGRPPTPYPPSMARPRQ
jgi:hypothetical protein